MPLIVGSRSRWCCVVYVAISSEAAVRCGRLGVAAIWKMKPTVTVINRSEKEREDTPERLSLAKQLLTEIPLLVRETSLRELDISHNAIEEISNIPR